MTKKQVAIYMTNTDDSDFAQRHPDDVEKVTTSLRDVGADFDFIKYEVMKGEFPADPTRFDAVILTGSPAYVDDPEGWIARLLEDIRVMVAARTPLVGLCFGHQAIIAALGGQVSKRDFWIFGATGCTVTGRRPWMQPPLKDMRLYAANSAQADRLPDGMQLLATSGICPIAMTCFEDHVFTTQFHPEMSDEFVAALVEEYDDFLGAEVAQASRESLTGGAHGSIFMTWVRQFIELERG